MLEEMRGRAILVCIILAVCAGSIAMAFKLPENIVAGITWTPVEPVKLFQNIGKDESEGEEGGVPEKVKIDDVKAMNQHPGYPTGCESVSLYILLQHYGVDVTVDEIVEKLPKGNMPTSQNGGYYGANPEKKFVGNPKSENSFGVYNGPIAKTAEHFRKGAVAESKVSLERIKEIVSAGNPVIAWTTITYGRKPEVTATWRDEDTGEKIRWMGNEHAVVIYGYDENSLYISDPYEGIKGSVSKELFMKSYSCFGGRVVYYEK